MRGGASHRQRDPQTQAQGRPLQSCVRAGGEAACGMGSSATLGGHCDPVSNLRSDQANRHLRKCVVKELSLCVSKGRKGVSLTVL